MPIQSMKSAQRPSRIRVRNDRMRKELATSDMTAIRVARELRQPIES